MANIKKIVRKSAKLAAKGMIRTLPQLPGRPGRLTGTLAKEGGLPVRDTRYRPWPSLSLVVDAEWTTKIAPKFLQIFLTGVEDCRNRLRIASPRNGLITAAHDTRCCCRTAPTHCASRFPRPSITMDGVRRRDHRSESFVHRERDHGPRSAVWRRAGRRRSRDVLARSEARRRSDHPGKTRAIMAVHLFGQPADMTALRDIAKATFAGPARRRSASAWRDPRTRPRRSIGDAAGFSFQSSKNLSSGEGGAFTTNDLQIFERAYSFHNVGRARRGGQRWGHHSLGFNMRPTEYVAAILLHRLAKLEAEQQRRAENFHETCVSTSRTCPAFVRLRLDQACSVTAFTCS